uniref:glutathione transferase n=1 Tax=Neovison vison TaxID=452646 RepID=A0A8C7BKR4_NEOVI
MESVRWVLAATGIEFDEEFLETKERLQKLQDGNHLLFQQVPMVEIDGMKLVQTGSILHCIADKHHLLGKDLKERTLIDINIPTIKKFLEPDSKKKPPPDDIYVRTFYNIFMP